MTASPAPASQPQGHYLKALVGGLIFLVGLLTSQPAPASEASIDDLPPVVLAALAEAVPDLVIDEVEIEEEDDGLEFEIHGTSNGHEVEAKLNALGEFLELRIEGADGDGGDHGSEGSLPGSIEDALDELVPGASITASQHHASDPLDYFAISAHTGSREFDIALTPGGLLLHLVTHSLEIDPAAGTRIHQLDLPVAVAAAADDLVIESIRQIGTTNPIFLIEAMRHKARITAAYDSNGALLFYDLDRDADGLGDLAELATGTAFDHWDTDRDNYPDGFEIAEGSNPLDAISFPQILSLHTDDVAGTLRIQVRTFRGADFLLEQCGSTSGTWVALGGCFTGDGSVADFVLPIVEEIQRCFFRIAITPDPEEAGQHATDSSTSTGENCTTPRSVVGREIRISDDDGEEQRSLAFGSESRGEIVERDRDEVDLCPFAYTYQQLGDCKARVTLTFSTSDGFETEVFTLTFTSETSGAYLSQDYEDGQAEDPQRGEFTITMN